MVSAVSSALASGDGGDLECPFLREQAQRSVAVPLSEAAVGLPRWVLGYRQLSYRVFFAKHPLSRGISCRGINCSSPSHPSHVISAP